MNVIYLRSSEDAPALAVQEHTIKNYLHLKGEEAAKIEVDGAPMSALLDERKEFKSFIHSLQRGDRLFVYDLRSISPRVGELVQFFNCLFEHGLELVVTRYALHIKEDSFAKILIKALNLVREENRRGAKMGRPKGSISRSKYDRYRESIIAMIKEGKSVSEIAKALGASRSSVRDYIVSRNLKEIAAGEEIFLEPLPTQHCKLHERKA